MKRSQSLLVLFAALTLALASGCESSGGGDDNGGGSDVAAGTDTATPEDVPVATDFATGDLPSVFVPDEAPDPNPACVSDRIDGDPTAASVAWKGLSYKGYLFTCNYCPEGDALIQGKWRFYNATEEDPTIPTPEEYAETLEIEGNRWTVRIDGPDESIGQRVQVVAEGWYFCGDQPEVPDKTKIFVTTSADPEGGYGYETNLVFRGYTLQRGEPGTDTLLRLYDELCYETSPASCKETYQDLGYCKIGETIFGAECLDPFE